MRMRWMVGLAAATALVGGAFGASGAAQAESMTCSSWLGNSAACQENYFGRDNAPAWGTVVVVGNRTYAGGWAAQAMHAAQAMQAAQTANRAASRPVRRRSRRPRAPSKAARSRERRDERPARAVRDGALVFAFRGALYFFFGTAGAWPTPTCGANFGVGCSPGRRHHRHLLLRIDVAPLLGDCVGDLGAEQDDDAGHVDPEQQRHHRADRAVAADHVSLLQ